MRLFLIILFVLLIFVNTKDYCSNLVFQNKLQKTQEEIYSREKYIQNAAKSFNINPRVLAIIIFTERYLNYTYIDKELDFLLLDFGINASVGFAQVKLKTAEWVEKELNTTTEHGYLGKMYLSKLPISSLEQIKIRLHSDSLNIMYAAAYLAIYIKMWKELGKDIHDNISVLATLYSHGYISPDKFKVNSFGENAHKFYYSKVILNNIQK